MSEIRNHNSRNNENLAFQFIDCGEYCFVWLCGYHSDFSGSKATQMAQTALELGVSSLRFDYSGNGASGGQFEDGTISKWLEDAFEIIQNYVANKKLILVGSSMGGWIALLLTKRLNNIVGLCLIAPAPDFTEDLMWARFDEETRKEMQKCGYWLRPSDYSPEPYKVTLELIENGRKNLVLRDKIDFKKPIIILHGMNDKDVPFERSLGLSKIVNSENLKLIFIKDGDHRLSRESDLRMLGNSLKELFLEVQAEH